MAQQAIGSNLSDLIGSDSEDEFQRNDVNALLTPDSATENAKQGTSVKRASKATTTKAKAKNKTQQQPPPPPQQQQRVMKARGVTRRAGNDTIASESAGTGAGRPVRKKRTALAERPNLSDTEEVDDLDAAVDGNATEQKAVWQKPAGQTQNKRNVRSATAVSETASTAGRPTRERTAAATRKGRPAKAKADDPDATASAPDSALTGSVFAGGRKATNRRGRIARNAEYDEDEIVNSPEISRIIPETQQERHDTLSAGENVSGGIDDSLGQMDIHPPLPRTHVNSTPMLPSASSARKGSALKPKVTSASARHRRAGSASDTERTNDPALRRKLSEMTTKFESMELKYRNMKEIGVQDADTNFERLKLALDERSKAQEAIITSLKKELDTQKSLATENKSIRSQLAAANSDKSKAEAENKRLSTSLREAQTEVKGLSAKLAAARQASVQRAESAPPRGPGSATKSSTTTTRFINSEVSGKDSAQLHLLKEELYRDLTDLVILGVKEVDGNVVYDCIQTGRNGTLHFHLSTPSQDSNPKSSTDYQDAEFDYTPLLNEKRDQGLLEILPDFLTDEIQFPRSHAAGFYTKLFENMKRKIEVGAEADIEAGVEADAEMSGDDIGDDAE